MAESGAIALEHARILKGPHQLAFDITNQCNFRCLHCYNSSGENWVTEEEMSDEEVLEFIDDVAAMQPLNFCFCGGETLLRKKLLYLCAEKLRNGNVKYVSMVTNGYLIDEIIARDLVNSGINRIQVSIDGADAKTHERLRQKAGAFEQVIKAVHLSKNSGMEIEVAFCPTTFNIEQIRDMHRLCADLEVNRLRIQPLMFLGRANENLEAIAPSPMQYRQLVKTIHELEKRGLPPPIEWGDPVDHLVRFRSLCEHCVPFVSVKANGGIAASAYLPLVVGNVKKHKLSEYWDAGLPRIWELELVKNLAKRIRSIADYNKTEPGVPIVWKDRDIEIDLIDDLIMGKKSIEERR